MAQARLNMPARTVQLADGTRISENMLRSRNEEDLYNTRWQISRFGSLVLRDVKLRFYSNQGYSHVGEGGHERIERFAELLLHDAWAKRLMEEFLDPYVYEQVRLHVRMLSKSK